MIILGSDKYIPGNNLEKLVDIAEELMKNFKLDAFVIYEL